MCVSLYPSLSCSHLCMAFSRRRTVRCLRDACSRRRLGFSLANMIWRCTMPLSSPTGFFPLRLVVISPEQNSLGCGEPGHNYAGPCEAPNTRRRTAAPSAAYCRSIMPGSSMASRRWCRPAARGDINQPRHCCCRVRSRDGKGHLRAGEDGSRAAGVWMRP